MKNILLAAALVMITLSGYSQSKVFKEVSDDVTSQIKAITQDGNLVGYLVFTELEKASENTYNYRLTIMDENLNDIGTVNFKDEKLFLQQVSFEQDVLCLAYIKSNIIGKEFKNARQYRKEKENDVKNSIFTQFVSLDGKIINSNLIKADIASQTAYNNRWKIIGDGKLKHNV